MRLSLLASVALALFTLAAHADTLTFSYSGNDTTGIGGSSSGTGTISFAGDPASLTLASLTGFSFTQTTIANGVGTATFNYTLANLTSFSSTEVGDTLLTLMLSTNSL